MQFYRIILLLVLQEYSAYIDMNDLKTTVNGYKEDMKSLGVAVDGYAKFLQKAAATLNTTQEEIKNLASRL